MKDKDSESSKYTRWFGEKIVNRDISGTREYDISGTREFDIKGRHEYDINRTREFDINRTREFDTGRFETNYVENAILCDIGNVNMLYAKNECTLGLCSNNVDSVKGIDNTFGSTGNCIVKSDFDNENVLKSVCNNKIVNCEENKFKVNKTVEHKKNDRTTDEKATVKTMAQDKLGAEKLVAENRKNSCDKKTNNKNSIKNDINKIENNYLQQNSKKLTNYENKTYKTSDNNVQDKQLSVVICSGKEDKQTNGKIANAKNLPYINDKNVYQSYQIYKKNNEYVKNSEDYKIYNSFVKGTYTKNNDLFDKSNETQFFDRFNQSPFSFPVKKPFFSLSSIFTTRAASAPPDDSLFLHNSFKDISYSAYYRKNSKTDIRLPVPMNFVLGSELYQSLIERIDADHPFSESIKYKGETSRSTTPIGNYPFLKEISCSVNEFEEEIRKYCSDEKICVDEKCKDEIMNRQIGVLNKSLEALLGESKENEDSFQKRKFNTEEVKKNSGKYFEDEVNLHKNNESCRNSLEPKNSTLNDKKHNFMPHNNYVNANKNQKTKNIEFKNLDEMKITEYQSLNEYKIKDVNINEYKNYDDKNYLNSFKTDRNDFIMNEKQNRIMSGNYEEKKNINSKTLCYILSTDQEGSRFIQKRLEKSSISDLNWFFSQIKDKIKDLSLDLFGNYVIQKLLELENPEINLEIIRMIRKHGEELALHMYGCRVIQKIFELDNINPEEILFSFKNNIITLIEDQNGNHVVQKCVEKVKDCSFIIKEFKRNGIKLSKHRYGCRVVQRLFENCKDEDIKDIVIDLSKNIPILIEDQYGNYVLQHIIQNKKNLRNYLIDEIMKIKDEKIMEYCMHKFASNVIEKCVMFCEDFIDTFLKSFNNKPIIVWLSIDRYGNYVVQRILERKKKNVACVLKMYINDLKKSIYAKHIISKIQ
ncbi:hypothetical protein COBT_002687 [Conglomerata obtusa]